MSSLLPRPRPLLLLFLFVSVLSVCQARVVSRCELRDELLKRVHLPRNLQRNPERALARVICEVERFSHLSTTLVREYEKEIIDLDETTTAAITTTSTTTTTTTTTTTNILGGDNPAVNTSLTRERRSVRQKRASISVVSVKYFGIFQYSDQEYCDSGYSYSEDRCMSDCFAFADDDITDDVECFVQSLFWDVYRGAVQSCKSKKTLDSFFEACDAGEEPGSGEHLGVWFSISTYN